MVDFSLEIDKQLDALIAEDDPASRLQGATVVLQDAVESGYELGIAAAHVLQGNALWQMSQFTEAISAFDKAVARLTFLPDCYWHVLLHFGYGNVYRELGVFEQALEHFLTALKIAGDIQDEILVMKAESNLGTVSIFLGDYNRGIASFLNVLKLAEAPPHHHIRFSTYINLAAAYHYIGDYQSAVAVAEKALPLANLARELVQTYGNLGVAYTGSGDYEKARYYLEKSLAVARESHFTLEQCVCSVDLADYHIKIGEDDRAIQLLREGLAAAEAINFRTGIRDCHQRLHALFRKQQHWEQALFHHEQLHSIDRAMFNDSSDARVRHLETLHKVAQLRDTNERQRRELEVLTQMRNALLSDLSHDLRNPLGTLRLTLSVFKGIALKLPDEDRWEFAELYDRANIQIDRMARLISDVLDMARYDAGAGLEPQRTNVGELIGEVCAGFHGHARAKNITLQCRPEGALYMLADVSAIRRMLENLVSNAIKYTPDGGRVEVEAARDESNVIIRIKDNGVGISEDQLPRIFERFYRVPAYRQMAEGTGLGMAIVKSIVDNHHGSIHVASAVNHGTTVTVTLPA